MNCCPLLFPETAYPGSQNGEGFPPPAEADGKGGRYGFPPVPLWAVPEGEDMTSHDVLERAIRNKHLIPVREADLVLVCGEDSPDGSDDFEDSEGMDLPDDFDDLDGYDEPDDPGEGWDE